MPTWLETTLTILKELCWQCRLVEWLGGLEQGAAVTLFVGVLNAGAIIAVALIARQTLADFRMRLRVERQEKIREEVMSLAHKVEMEFFRICTPILLNGGPQQDTIRKANHVLEHIRIPPELVLANWAGPISQGQIYFGEEVGKKFDSFANFASELDLAAKNVLGTEGTPSFEEYERRLLDLCSNESLANNVNAVVKSLNIIVEVKSR